MAIRWLMQDGSYKTSHEGLVIQLRETNGYHDSDFYALVWNPELGTSEKIEYDTTRFQPSGNIAKVDATPETLAAWEAWSAKVRAEYEAANALIAAKCPEKGKQLLVVAGRKVKKSTVGRCFWAGETRWGKSVGIELENGERVFTARKNVEVTDWANYLPAGHPALAGVA